MALLASTVFAQLFNGKNLDGWEVVGVWTARKDGVLPGDRIPGKSSDRSWLYTRRKIESRNEIIRVKASRVLVCKHPGEPGWPNGSR
jgi:hypothetical protein